MTFLLCFWEVQYGIMAGVLVSGILLLYSVARPPIKVGLHPAWALAGSLRAAGNGAGPCPAPALSHVPSQLSAQPRVLFQGAKAQEEPKELGTGE